MGRAEGFLARWSRRKRLAAAPAPAAPDPVTPAKPPETLPLLPERAQEAAIAMQQLPPIESLDAGSDITPFLAPGVPVGLTRQALRRAWMADPTVRDFIGLSENAWDFTAAGGVPGFGALSAEDAGRLLARALGAAGSADAPHRGKEAAEPAADTAAPGGETEADRPAEDQDHDRYRLDRSGQIAGDAGTPQDFGEAEINRPAPPRSRGGALPK
jgi:Protein of unknown function (DUF3306)